MKSVLQSKACLIICAVLFLFVSANTKAADNVMWSNALKNQSAKDYSRSQVKMVIDSGSLKLVSSISVDSVYTIQILNDTASLRFHFTVIKSNIREYQSGNLSSDFAIINGFISIFDSQRIAMILIEKIKSGNTEPSINKSDLELNGIPLQ